MKIVHAADLHLDSPLRGLERYDGAPAERIRGATRRALKNLVALCIEERAGLLLIAGDLYDGDWRDHSTGLFFAQQMAMLKEANVRVAWIRGNHDARSRIAHHLRLPSNVTELSSRHPETIHLDDLGIAVHGQGFATPAVTQDLAATYPDAEKGLINIGLLHTALDGREGHDRYAPCRLDALVHKGYDYWALGHVHQREVLHEDPWVVFPGNLQGRHAKETGSKGATLIHADNGRIVGIEHRALDEVRFARCEIDATSASSEDEILERLAAGLEATARASEGRLFAAKVILTGTTRAHAAIRSDPDRFVNEVRALGLEVGGGGAWIERVEIETQPERRAAPAARGDDPIGALLLALDSMSSDEDALRELGSELDDLKHKLPVEIRQGPDGFALDDARTLRELVGEVRDLLLPRLEAPGEKTGAA